MGYCNLGNAISIALAYVAIGSCGPMKRERNGNHFKKTDVTMHMHMIADLEPPARGRYAPLVGRAVPRGPGHPDTGGAGPLGFAGVGMSPMCGHAAADVLSARAIFCGNDLVTVN